MSHGFVDQYLDMAEQVIKGIRKFGIERATHCKVNKKVRTHSQRIASMKSNRLYRQGVTMVGLQCRPFLTMMLRMVRSLCIHAVSGGGQEYR